MLKADNAGRRSWWLVGAAVFAAGLVGSAAVAQPQPAAKPGDLLWSVASAEGSSLYAVAVDAQGVYVVGNSASRERGGGRIEKRNPADGSLIWATHADVGELMHIDIDAESMYLSASPWKAEKRRLSDGSLIWEHTCEFGGKPYGVVIDSQAMYISGRDGKGQWRVEKRRLSDGAVLWNQMTVSGVALAVAVDDTGVYLGGYDRVPGDQQWRIEKRSLTDGSLIWEVTHNPSKEDEKVYGMAVDASGVYAAGFDSAVDAGQWRIEKRNLSDGKLIWEKVDNPSPGLDKAHGLSIDATGLYIPGYDKDQMRVEKRSLEDGSLIWVGRSNPGGKLWYAVAVDDTAVYVGGNLRRQWRIEKWAK
jgi:hypothetical protein